MKILVIHGPNLNLLGIREPDKYGDNTLSEINEALNKEAAALKAALRIVQYNSEGDIVDEVQSALTNYDGIIINPAAYTHTSVAIRDAISAVSIPTVEVHLSNVHSREDFRLKSYTAPVCIGQISGFGYYSYILALKAIVKYLKK